MCNPLRMEEFSSIETQPSAIPRIHTHCFMLEVNTAAVCALAAERERDGTVRFWFFYIKNYPIIIYLSQLFMMCIKVTKIYNYFIYCISSKHYNGIRFLKGMIMTTLFRILPSLPWMLREVIIKQILQKHKLCENEFMYKWEIRHVAKKAGQETGRSPVWGWFEFKFHGV